jgi:hypothetical protein
MNQHSAQNNDIQPKQALKAILGLSFAYSAVVFSMAQLFVMMR